VERREFPNNVNTNAVVDGQAVGVGAGPEVAAAEEDNIELRGH
jgi:hypothetical protein